MTSSVTCTSARVTASEVLIAEVTSTPYPVSCNVSVTLLSASGLDVTNKIRPPVNCGDFASCVDNVWVSLSALDYESGVGRILNPNRVTSFIAYGVPLAELHLLSWCQFRVKR